MRPVGVDRRAHAASPRLLAVAVAATWGLNFVVIEVGLEEVPPLLLCALRFALVALPLVFFVRAPPIPWRLIAGIGVALGVVKFGLLFTSMDVGMPAGLASVVLQAQAPFTLLLAARGAARAAGARPARGPGGRAGGHRGDRGAARWRRHGRGAERCASAAAAAWAVANLLMKRASDAEPLALMVWISLIPPLPLLGLSLVVDGPHAVGDALARPRPALDRRDRSTSPSSPRSAASRPGRG